MKLIFKENKEYDFKLSIDNCNFLKTEIKYLGYVIEEKGRKLDSARFPVINISVSTLQTFWGLANYYSNFIPKIHALRAPLNWLLKKNTIK